MKTKITLLIGAVALITLSFTFTSVDTNRKKIVEETAKSKVNTPIGGIMVDEVIQ